MQTSDIPTPVDTANRAPEEPPDLRRSASVVKQFVQCPKCGKIWPHDGHAADVCCGGCSHNFYVPPDAMTRRLHECESMLRSANAPMKFTKQQQITESEMLPASMTGLTGRVPEITNELRNLEGFTRLLNERIKLLTERLGPFMQNNF